MRHTHTHTHAHMDIGSLVELLINIFLPEAVLIKLFITRKRWQLALIWPVRINASIKSKATIQGWYPTLSIIIRLKINKAFSSAVIILL